MDALRAALGEAVKHGVARALIREDNERRMLVLLEEQEKAEAEDQQRLLDWAKGVRDE